MLNLYCNDVKVILIVTEGNKNSIILLKINVVYPLIGFILLQRSVSRKFKMYYLSKMSIDDNVI